jgi:hypothetical protein
VQAQSTAHYHETESKDRGIWSEDSDANMDVDGLPITNSDIETIAPSSSDEGDDIDSELESSSGDDLHSDIPAVEVLASQVVQMVTDRLVTQKGAMTFMKVFRQYLNRIGVEDTEYASSLPVTYYTMKKLASLQV